MLLIDKIIIMCYDDKFKGEVTPLPPPSWTLSG